MSNARRPSSSVPSSAKTPDRRKSDYHVSGGVKPNPAPDGPRRPSCIMPPDRALMALNENSNRKSSHAPIPSAAALTVPEKSRRTSSARPLNLSFSHVSGSANSSSMRSILEEKINGSGGKKVTSAMVFKKRDKAEVNEYYSKVKAINNVFKSNSGDKNYFGSLSSCGSTASSMSSNFSVTADVMEALRRGSPAPDELPSGPAGPESWSLRWCIDKSGRQPGQIKCVRDACILRNGHIAAAESKNARIQLFNNAGKSLACLGEMSENTQTAQSFRNPLTYRRMEATGLCELNVEDNILAVTDLNRLLYVDASSHGGLQNEVLMKGKTQLHGIAVNQAGKLIICELGMQPSVGLYENTGKLIKEFPCQNFKRPAYVSWSDEYEIAAVADSEENCVFIFDANGRYLNRFGQAIAGGQNESTLVYPSGLCWMPEGRLLIADRANHRVVLFDLRNMSFEVVLSQADGLNQPVALSSNRRNRIVISEEFHDFGVNKYQFKMFKYTSAGMVNNNEF